jgi:Tol biopolymer transport system component
MKIARILVFCPLLSVWDSSLLAQNIPRTATAPHGPSSSASGASTVAELSPDGRYILFVSNARNLVTNDGLDGSLNIYRYDRVTRETLLISTSADGSGGGNKNSFAPSASTNGLVAFTSAATNLISGDTNSAEDVFVRDCDQNTTRLVSIARDGSAPVNPAPSLNQPLSGNPLISADGRYIAFESRATGLAALPDNNSAYDVFVYDTQGQSVRLITANSDGTATANGSSRLGAITPDGRVIAIMSAASDLVQNPATTGNEELYLCDLVTGQKTCVSCGLRLPYPNVPAPTSSYRCFNPVLSVSGTSLVFKAVAPGQPTAGAVLFATNTLSVLGINTDLVWPPRITPDGAVVVYDNAGHLYRNAQRITTNAAPNSAAGHPIISADANKIAYLAEFAYDPPQPSSGPQLYVHDFVAGVTRQITSDQNHALAGFSIDSLGAYLAFDSPSGTFVSNDFNQAKDVFLHDLYTGQTTLVSTREASLPASTAGGGNSISKFSFSADARKLVFTSLDSNLAPGDTNRSSDVFVRDLVSGELTALSDSNGVFVGNVTALDPMISANGRYVTLRRRGRNVITREDLQTGRSDVVSSNASFVLTRTDTHYSPLSRDGRLVVFTEYSRVWLRDMDTSTNREIVAAPWANPPILSPDDSSILYRNENSQLALHDVLTGTNIIIGPDAEPYGFSANSRYVIYGNLRYDRASGSNLLVCTSCTNLTISGDGRLVAYENISGTSRDIELRDLEANRTTLISQNAQGGSGNARSTSPVLSHDGAYLVFVSRASDLVSNDNNDTADIFVYDVRLKKLIRIAGQLPDAGSGAGPASNPVLASNGRTLAFQSFSARMVANDFDHQADIFILRLGAGDSDDDALPDDWEVAYFGNLAQNASDDFDSDGHNNGQEYTAGTDPTNQNSVLRVISITSASTGEVQLFWNAIPGKRYRVEYKNSLADTQWSSLPNLYTSGTATDPNSAFGPSKFYRVIALD